MTIAKSRAVLPRPGRDGQGCTLGQPCTQPPLAPPDQGGESIVPALPRSSVGECSRTILGGESVVLPQNSTFGGCPPPILGGAGGGKLWKTWKEMIPEGSDP